jgi:DNA-binding TFAR19-related protein (PDSD5 family)
VLGEQANEALNRISSLDWTEGFTPAAGAEIANLLSSVLDPAAIQNLLNKALGADKTVSGLEKQLENLKAAAQLDVEFSAEQVQGALDAITAESPLTVTEIVTTPEAAQAVYDVIKGVLADPTNELTVLIDRDNIAKQTLEAAEEGARQTHLIFDSTVAFNEAGLTEAAREAAATFITEFNAQQRAMQAALGPAVAGAITPQVPFLQTVSVTTPITVNGAQDRIATAAEVIAAQSASAGSGGQLSRTLQEIYGYRPAAGQTAS